MEARVFASASAINTPVRYFVQPLSFEEQTNLMNTVAKTRTSPASSDNNEKEVDRISKLQDELIHYTFCLSLIPNLQYKLVFCPKDGLIFGNLYLISTSILMVTRYISWVIQLIEYSCSAMTVTFNGLG